MIRASILFGVWVVPFALFVNLMLARWVAVLPDRVEGLLSGLLVGAWLTAAWTTFLLRQPRRKVLNG